MKWLDRFMLLAVFPISGCAGGEPVRRLMLVDANDVLFEPQVIDTPPQKQVPGTCVAPV